MALNIGLIGLGNIIRPHVDALRADKRFRIAAVCDVDAARRAHWARELKCPAFDRHDALLAADSREPQ